MKKIYFLLIVCFVGSGVLGQVNYVSWDFTTNITNANYSTNTTNQNAARSSALNAPTLSTITINGTGITGTVGNTFHRSTGWPVAIDVTKYLEFSVTLNNGQTFQNAILSLAISAQVSSNTTAANSYQVQYGWGASPVFANATNGTVTGLTTAASSNTATIPAPGNTTTTILRIRLVGYNAQGAGTGNIQFRTIQLTAASAPISPTPTTTSISPSSATAGDPGFSLTVNGTNFINGLSTVRWGGATRTTTFNSGTQLTATIPAGDIATAGSALVDVITTGALSTSNTQTFTINGGAPPTKLVITAVSPTTPTRNASFSITVQAQDNSNNPQNVISNTAVNLARTAGTGNLGGTISGTITAGSNTVVFTGLTYDVAETGVEITASDAGAILTAGTTTFTVSQNATQLAFVAVPPTGTTNNVISTFTVEARKPDNSLDNTYTGNITVTKATGPGTLSGTTTVAAIGGIATFSTVQFDQAGAYTLDAMAGGLATATSGTITITAATAATDYFRSAVTTGDWSTVATWESSTDNVTWVPSTIVPGANANTIYIKAGNTITVSTAVTADQVIIENTAVLLNSAGAFTIADGTGDDITIENGGVFTVGSASGPVFGAGTPTVNVNTGGILRVARSSYTGAGAGMNLANYIYQDAAIVEYTLPGQFSTSGVTYFPNVSAGTVPIFRVTGTIAAAVGAGGNTTFNGIFETATPITFAGSGIKTFRNGITGAGNINGSGSGKFVINGATATLGGTGTLQLPTTDGMDISTNVNLISAKAVTGNIALLTGGYIQLGNNDLTVTGSITGGGASSYIKTNGTGSLILKNITTATMFPVGNGASYTPATITNTGIADDFAVNVAAGTPCNADPNQSVNRVWTITEATAGGSIADITMQWNTGDENLSFIRLLCSAVHCAGGVIDLKGAKGTATGTDPYSQTITSISSFSPFGVTSDNVVLPIGIQYFDGFKQTGSHILNWKVNCTTSSSVTMSVERSSNGRDFNSIYAITADAARCLDAFTYTDAGPLPGVNYYRLRSVDIDGKVTYSNTVALMNATKGLQLINISPNPTVNGQFKLRVASAQQMKMEVLITDMAGKVVARSSVTIMNGSNAIPMDVSKLSAGIYQLSGITSEGRTATLSFIRQ